MKKIFYFVLIAIVATSCKGIYLPYATNHFGAQSQVVLNQANFRVVRNVEVVVDFDNTNMRRAEAEKSAYGELLREAQLTGSQVLINVVIEEVLRKGLHRHQYVAARATIIEFLDENGNPTISQSYRPSYTQTTNVLAQPVNDVNTYVVQEVEETNTRIEQEMASAEDIQKCEQVHIQIKKLAYGYPGSYSSKKYSRIYTTLPRTKKNMLILQKIQSVVTLYLRSQGTAYPKIEKQLKNASSIEEDIAIFLSYYKEQ